MHYTDIFQPRKLTLRFSWPQRSSPGNIKICNPQRRVYILKDLILGKHILSRAVSDILSLSLEKGNGTRISRKLEKEYSAKRFIVNNRTETKQFEINVRKDNQVSANLVINAQFPVSTTKEIIINDQKALETQVDKDSGIITWNLSLLPGQEKNRH